jgi:hypothetical protein
MGEWMYRSTFPWPRHYEVLLHSWRWVVTFTPRPLYPRYILDRRLGGPQNQSGRREENFWSYRDSNSNLSLVQLVVSHYTDCTISVPLLYLYTYLFIYLFIIYLDPTTLSGAQSTQCQSLSVWLIMHVKTVVVCSNWGKLWKTSVRIAGIPAKIRILYLWSISQE